MDELINKVIAQIEKDLANGDTTALDLLLLAVPVENLQAYLPEEN
jgi:hypothetical protein